MWPWAAMGAAVLGDEHQNTNKYLSRRGATAPLASDDQPNNNMNQTDAPIQLGGRGEVLPSLRRAVWTETILLRQEERKFPAAALNTPRGARG